MTIIATGNTSLLKPGCPCCECPCAITLNYEVRGWSQDEWPNSPLLIFNTPDCSGNTLSGYDEITANYDYGVVQFATENSIPHISQDFSALFVEWRIVHLGKTPGIDEDWVEYKPDLHSYVTVTSDDCNYVCTAMFEYGVGTFWLGLGTPTCAESYAALALRPEGVRHPNPYVRAWYYHRPSQGGPSSVRAYFAADSVKRTGAGPNYVYHPAWLCVSFLQVGYGSCPGNPPGHGRCLMCGGSTLHVDCDWLEEHDKGGGYCQSTYRTEDVYNCHGDCPSLPNDYSDCV